MPIKLSNRFQRRKSSSNALDEVINPPEPSFRVFERPQPGSKSFDGGYVVNKESTASVNRQAPPMNNNDEYDNDELFPVSKEEPRNRGSSGTENSETTGAPYGSEASSAHQSSYSTLPSSTDAFPDLSVTSATQRPFHNIPVPPQHSSRNGHQLRHTDSGLSSKSVQPSFGLFSRKPVPVAKESIPDPLTRNVSAATVTSASTATPPRLPDADLALGDSDLDSFSHMFDSIGKSSPRNGSPTRGLGDKGPLSSQSGPSDLPDTLRLYRSALRSPLNIERLQAADSSPYSFTSHGSQDRLIGSPSPIQSLSRDRDLPAIPPSGHPELYQDSFRSRPRNDYPHPKSPSPSHENEAIQRRQIGFLEARQRFEKTGGRATDPQPPRPGRRSTAPTNSEEELYERHNRGSSVKRIGDVDASLIAAHWQEVKRERPGANNKVMTPAQFEKYKHEQERSKACMNDSDDNDSNIDEDEDQVERDREATKQRRKQEAHLAVYRQTMMKVTGDESEPRPVSFINNTGKLSMSAPDLTRRMSDMAADLKSPVLSDAEEDEDVPLGILAAHGFPHKNRPPSRIISTASNPNLRAASVAGDTKVGGKGSLPPFARALPSDPYFGASLVNQSNRESFAMRAGGSVYGGVPAAPPNVHPSGLVGVIVDEEQARAMRRGSPNAQGSYDAPGMGAHHPGMVRSQTMGNMPTVGFPGMPPGMAWTPGDQAQIQMSTQMNQMSQMMQWMQQMMLMQQGQGQSLTPPPMTMLGQPNYQPGMPADFLAPPPLVPRPLSMPIPPSLREDGRTMSMDPNMAPWNMPASLAQALSGGVPNGRTSYAPSIAPSERSNVGLASRYRPVSVAPAEPLNLNSSKRSSTFTSGTFQPWAGGNVGRQSPGAPTIRVVPLPGQKKTNLQPDDEDDDQGWAEMSRKREKKKSSWKSKKTEIEAEQTVS